MKTEYFAYSRYVCKKTDEITIQIIEVNKYLKDHEQIAQRIADQMNQWQKEQDQEGEVKDELLREQVYPSEALKMAKEEACRTTFSFMGMVDKNDPRSKEMDIFNNLLDKACKNNHEGAKGQLRKMFLERLPVSKGEMKDEVLKKFEEFISKPILTKEDMEKADNFTKLRQRIRESESSPKRRIGVAVVGFYDDYLKFLRSNNQKTWFDKYEFFPVNSEEKAIMLNPDEMLYLPDWEEMTFSGKIDTVIKSYNLPIFSEQWSMQ